MDTGLVAWVHTGVQVVLDVGRDLFHPEGVPHRSTHSSSTEVLSAGVRHDCALEGLLDLWLVELLTVDVTGVVVAPQSRGVEVRTECP